MFIFSTIALLGVLCAVFPEDGLAMGGLSLRFPSITEVLSGRTSDNAADPEEVIAQREKAVKAAERKEMEEYMASDPARIHMPDGNQAYMDSFFAALEDAGSKHVGIVHYGDSQLEEDRITFTYRERLQERFGGNGAGLQCAKKNYTLAESVHCNREHTQYMVYGDESLRAGMNRYGPMGQFSRADSASVFSIRPTKANDGASAIFNRVKLYSGNLRSPLTVSCKGERKVVEGKASLNITEFALPDSTSSVNLSVAGLGDLYGISLTSDTGVEVDNIAMRSCSGTIFTAINQDQLRDYFKDCDARLIILQFGGNGVPYMKTGKSISSYCSTIRRQIGRIRELAPGVPVLFIGPSDMATSTGGKRQTWPHLETFIDSLQTNVNASGAAYWNLYEVMGGNGSMTSWVKHQPPLAGPDYIHFTKLGAEKVGNLFADVLLLYHDFYKLREDE